MIFPSEIFVCFAFFVALVYGEEHDKKTCENRGIWLENKGLFGCFCRDNFWGAWCQFSCNNGELRQQESGEFFCQCYKGFSGAYCQRRSSKSDERNGEECQNGGVFQASTGECRCPAPFFGAFCQFSCGNGQMKIWKSTMKVKGVIDRVWETLFGPDHEQDKEDNPLLDPNLLGSVAADNFLNYFHANTAKYYCECRPGFFGINCEYSSEQPMIPTITIRPRIQSSHAGQTYASVKKTAEEGNGMSLDAKLGIGFSVVLFLGLLAIGIAFWICKKRDDVIVRYVASPRPHVESPRLQKSDIVKIGPPPPAYQYEDQSKVEKKYLSDEKFA